MALYQNSVLKKYLKQQDSEEVLKAYKKFTKYFYDTKIQENIRSSKEEEYQGIFLTELFSKILGYTMKPNADYNLVAEYKNEKNSRKADGAILDYNGLKPIVLAVIELKGTNTKDLEKVRQQAFDYKANQTGCVYVITSNFEKVRFYINNAVDFEEFDLFNLTEERFALMYLCLAKDNILGNLPLKIKEASVQEEEAITKKFYKDYSNFKRELYRDLVKLNMKNDVFRTELNNEDADRANKNIKQNLFKKSQKLIDRFLFIFFAEDRGLLPPNSTVQILEQWNRLKDDDAYFPLYHRYKLYFNYLDQGRAGKNGKAEIFAYNGGLFKPDAVLDSLQISDDLLYKHTNALQAYDFESQVDVNILGHIFENSLNEIESVNAEIEGTDFDKQTTKRKKDGVFYTPKYITKYIVDNTVGKLCNEKKAELGVIEEEYLKSRKGRPKKTLEDLRDNLETYRDWLLQITILDPACGSGAFLNQALDFLIKEHEYIVELQTSLLGGGLPFPNIENTILENNIFGVDLNEESVEIAKLSLWLRTAQPRRKLNNLSSNIKCGNSLIDSKAVAGDKAFKWEEEFDNIFKEKEKKAFHITTATHDSRTSQRMIDHKVRLFRDGGTRPKAEGIWLEPEDETLITETVAQIVKEDQLNVMAFNICGDHLHMLLVCEEEEVSKIVQKIKAKTARAVNISKGITIQTREHAPLSKEKRDAPLSKEKGDAPLPNTRGKKQHSLWTQKFGNNPIKDEKQLYNTVEYIQNNRVKHELPPLSSNNGTGPIDKVIKEMCCNYHQAFAPETKGGFDVVIGNPPYVLCQPSNTNDLTLDYYKNFEVASYKIDLFHLFFEKSIQIMKKGGTLGFITPNTYLNNKYIKPLRNYILNNTTIEEVINHEESVFSEASVDVATIIFSKEKSNGNNKIKAIFSDSTGFFNLITEKQQSDWMEEEENLFNLKTEFAIDFNGCTTLDKICHSYFGIQAYDRKTTISDIKIDDNHRELIDGGDIYRYEYSRPKKYFNFLDEKIKSGGDESVYKHERIVVRQIGKTPVVGLCKSEIVTSNTMYNLYMKDNDFELLYILAILNSKLIKSYWNFKYSDGKQLFPKIKGYQLKSLPIPTCKKVNQFPLAEKSKDIIEYCSNKTRIKNKFTTYLQSQFGIEKFSKKLQNWHELEFGAFIKELNKTIKLRDLTPLDKLQEMEWMEVFETKKAEAQTLKAQIDKTDKEIDNMVYELYNLTDEEIAIVENS